MKPGMDLRSHPAQINEKQKIREAAGQVVEIWNCSRVGDQLLVKLLDCVNRGDEFGKDIRQRGCNVALRACVDELFDGRNETGSLRREPVECASERTRRQCVAEL